MKNCALKTIRYSRVFLRSMELKRGLRDLNGQGVLTGLTNISNVKAFKEVDGKKIPCDGELLYRGYDVRELVKGGIGSRYIYEEGAYLLLFGELPTKEQWRNLRP